MGCAYADSQLASGFIRGRRLCDRSWLIKEMGSMDNDQGGPVEMGAPMDYSEHEKTYNMFLVGAKWGTMAIVVLLIAMAAGFYGGAGIIGSILVFIILNIAGVFLLR